MKKYFNLLFLALFIFYFAGCSKDENPVVPEVPSNSDTASVWDDFSYPEVTFTNLDADGNGKYYSLYFEDPVQHLKDISLTVCKILYKEPSEAPVVTKIEYRLEVYENGVAYTIGLGSAAEKRIVFSTDYLSKIMNNRSKQEVKDEIGGVLVHEFTHAYQKACEYRNDGWSAIEGVADALRYLSGCDKISRRHSGGNWTDGYTTTGFFIVWLQEKKDPDFLYKFNQYVGKHYEFSWESAAYALIGESVQKLWDEYQADIR